MPKMKAIVKEREGPGFVLKEVDYPEPARGEVTIYKNSYQSIIVFLTLLRKEVMFF